LSKIYLRKLVESGVHFGHRVSRWNPKMDRFIYGKRNLIHIINLVETVKGLTRAIGFLKNICATGQQVVFVGTKRQIKNIVQSESERCGMPFVTERWLGGTLTNFQTIRARLQRLEQLEELESTGKLQLYSKKIQASLMRELRRIKKNLDGIRNMHRLPGAVVVVDPRNENIAVKEANKLGIPVIAVLDTDCDPDEVDIPVPGNDDAIRSVQLLLEKMVDAVNEGKANYDEKAALEARAEEAEEQFELASERRRSMQQGRGGGRRRPDSRSKPAPAPAAGGAGAEQAAPAGKEQAGTESAPGASSGSEAPAAPEPPAAAAPAKTEAPAAAPAETEPPAAAAPVETEPAAGDAPAETEEAKKPESEAGAPPPPEDAAESAPPEPETSEGDVKPTA
jgi:small subunit ribosomal protein S2